LLIKGLRKMIPMVTAVVPAMKQENIRCIAVRLEEKLVPAWNDKGPARMLAEASIYVVSLLALEG
jgi:hypothetical protein